MAPGLQCSFPSDFPKMKPSLTFTLSQELAHEKELQATSLD